MSITEAVFRVLAIIMAACAAVGLAIGDTGLAQSCFLGSILFTLWTDV